MTKLTNAELQIAIDSLLKYFGLREGNKWGFRRGWCGTDAPDGATKSVLADLLYEQLKRAEAKD